MISFEARQLETLLVEKLIPWLEAGTPIVLFDTPPRAPATLAITAQQKPPLPSIAARKIYPHVRQWHDENLNSIDVPVLGCFFEGQADYLVRRPPGKSGMQWTIPLYAGSFFLAPPGIPFTMGRCHSESDYVRGVFMHLRRDCINCFTYTMDHSKIWQTPRIFLYDLEAQLLAERAIQELRRTGEFSSHIASHYIRLILELMLRSIHEKRYTNEPEIVGALQRSQTTSALGPSSGMECAEAYILEHLKNPDLSCRDIALHAGVSERHLERLFKQHTGVAPFQFVQQQRLEKARTLLMNPGLPVSSIAHYCGFRRASHFSTWFARHNRCSPTAYRKRHGVRN